MQNQTEVLFQEFSAHSHSVELATNDVPFLRDSVRGHISYDLSYRKHGHVVNINSQNMSGALATFKSLKESNGLILHLGQICQHYIQHLQR